MTNVELTRYIKHYIEKDKTKSAIMLSGDWGTGKSHYIQHELIPELQKEGSVHCVTVSLYGLKTVNEISKSIYLELRAKALQDKGEAAATGKMVGKTVVKGITSFFGIDLSVSEEDMQQIYESIDLSGKLIILEDIERSQIGILELLGYVNNLVEQDGVKLLLVANENEIIKYEPIKPASPEQKKPTGLLGALAPSQERVYTDKTKEYLAVKEKTVGDTLQFEGNFNAAVQQIITSYENPLLTAFADEECIKDICRILEICKSNNLRSFIFACQKTVDIFEQITGSYDDDFIQSIFYGIVFFSLRLKSGKTMRWDGGETYSVNLGHENTPLFKFCYEYIMWQKLDVSKIPVASAALAQKRLYDKHKTNNDPDLRTLFNYHEHYEKDVIAAIQTITERLKNPEDISFYDYGAIAVYLVVVKDILGCDIDAAKKSLIGNLEGRGKELQLEYLFRIALGECSDSARAEYEDLRKQMGHALKKDTEGVPDFNYLPEQAEMFYSYVSQNDGLFHMRGRFARNLDIQRLAQMFAESTPAQKNDIRAAFLSVYRSVNIKQFITDDYSSIDELLTAIKKDAESQADKIQALQYSWFIENLTDILQRLK